MLGIMVSVVMVVAVGAGLWINGTPGYQRMLAQDERRSALLTWLGTRLEVHASHYGSLPDSLIEIGTETERVDPVTHEIFGYMHKGLDYQLCAVFALASDTSTRPEMPFRQHGKGRTCFDRTADVKNPGKAYHLEAYRL
ncbi:hypothetical protein [Luteibacter aegosomatissinici]|uniref:hypothetical protein n=1 Tax=Luteibacter aegosomatissinici TaxID=2911539 RepID=UPI001FFA814D|nr:hypothetical protein [Luteibacter aegosomatissinici]UPG95995.1 hypothetical protein L2Y97_07775 [Luteibacter aegosomatissinici]